MIVDAANELTLRTHLHLVPHSESLSDPRLIHIIIIISHFNQFVKQYVTVSGYSSSRTLPNDHSIAWGQGWGLPTPVSYVTGFSEVVKHIAALLPQRSDDRHNALSKTTYNLTSRILAHFC